MIKNYFKVAWRTVAKNKITSLINIGGLAIGLAVGILVMLMIAGEVSFDKFHSHLSNIYLVMKNDKNGGEINTFQSTPGPLANSVQGEIPGIKHVARTSFGGQQLIKSGDKSIYENGIYAEPDFFNIMSFPVVAGNSMAAAQDVNSVMLTERTAKKLFGREEAIGRIITLNNKYDLKIVAVLQDIPSNSTTLFDVVLPFRIYERENSDWITKWDNNSFLTWIELKPKTNVAPLNDKLKKLLHKNAGITNAELFAYPFRDLHMHGEFKNGIPSGGRFQVLLLLGVIGIFVLLIACINFMNLATARSERRAREVGVRKVLGAQRKFIIFQFLSEALLMTLSAMMLAIIIVRLCLPAFNRFSEKNISFDFSNWQICLALLTMTLLTSFVAGSYPAFFLSRFQPVLVLKGFTSRKKGGSVLRKVLVTSQFVISVFLIIVTIVIFKQLEYAHNRPLGYEQENLIEISARGDMVNNFSIFKNELLKIPTVSHVTAGSDNLLQFGRQTDGINWPGKAPEQNYLFTITSVEYDWAKTSGIPILEGRDFNPSFGTDSLACLVNEAAVKKMSLKTPIGTLLGDTKIIGVVQDFVFNTPVKSIEPLIIYLDRRNINHFFVRLRNDLEWRKTIARIEQVAKKLNPGHPFGFSFTKEGYQYKFKGIESTGQVISFIGGLAILISCLGLFALSSFVAEQRTKEIGIRKVLGATAGNVWFSLSKDFLKPVFIGFTIATPMAAFAMNKLLLSMDYHITLSWWMFAAAGIITIVVAIATVSFQAVKAATANPVESLRTE